MEVLSGEVNIVIVRMCDRCGAPVTPDVCNKQEIYLYKHPREVNAAQDILKTVTIDLCEQCYNELKNWINKKKTHDDVVIDKGGFHSVCENFEKFGK